MANARCFAKSVTGECTALYVDECDEIKCSFYKSIEQASADRRKAADRCKRLGIPSGKEYVVWKRAKELMETIESD